MHEGFRVPIGLRLSQTARTVSRAFDDALDAAGGTLPTWLILLNLKVRKPANQRELAEAVGVREATLTHHLNAMDAHGLITRTRDTANRRIHAVELTEAGEAAFLRMQQAAAAFDARLRSGLADADLDHLSDLLGRLAANAAADAADAADANAAGGNNAGGTTGSAARAGSSPAGLRAVPRRSGRPDRAGTAG